MVRKARTKNGPGTKRASLNDYFYYNGDLHCRLFVNRGRDTVVAWNYPQGKRMVYNYTDMLKRQEPAFAMRKVCQMMNRSRVTIQNAIQDGMIEAPQFTYGLDENRNKGSYMWSEKNLMDLLDYLSSVHHGRPRKDGVAIPKQLPTPRELRAMIHDEAVLYVKQGDTYVPTWRAKEL